MKSICGKLFLSTLIGASAVSAWCGDNGGAELGWGTQADSDGNGANPRTVLGFNASGPFDAVGNPVLSVIATNAGWDSSYYAFSAWICGQASPDAYPQTTFGPIVNADSISTQTSIPLCLTASALGESNITIALLPCVNDISTNPVPTQTFQWIGTAYITYGWAFLGNQSGTPLDPSIPTDYVPSLVPATNDTAAYLRLDYVPGGLPPSTGLETGLVLELSDD
ncbi:hypothetical protein FB451DRAFT_246715 [Mycena latifolia]|nr:hypothetical protein FB451DRAFT_246715 [Mycena latifolia]